MSPEAVTARLKLTGQLWELSVKLMPAEKAELPEVEDSEAGLQDKGRSLEKSKTKSRRDEIFVEREDTGPPKLL